MGATKKVVVKLNISNDGLLPAFRFTCEFKIDGKSTTVNGRLFGEKLYCDAVQLMYSADSPNVSATFNVLRNGLIPLANPDNIHGTNLFRNAISFHVNENINNAFSVVIYRCGEPNARCEECLKLPKELNCGWCQTKSQCNVHEQCDRFDEQINDWLSPSSNCPKSPRSRKQPFSNWKF